MLNYTDEVEKYGSVRAASRALGIPRTTLQRALKRERGEGFETVEQDVVKTSDALTDACEAMNILQHEVKAGWIKSKEASVYVKRDSEKVTPELTTGFIELLDSARRTVLRPSECRSADTMMVISLHDAHFGKLSWSKTAGENYDPSITSVIYRQAVSDALTHFNPTRVRKIVLPIGSDMVNFDNAKSETTAGTRVESCDDRIHKVFDIAVASVIAAVEDCVQIADTEILVIPGNHDETLSILIAKVVKQYFRFDSRVTVDDSELSRKYLHWGKNLICFTHRFMKPASAPMIMAVERPWEFANSVCREIHTGHLHTRRATVYEPYSEYNGVMVRILPSISAADTWHVNQGFVGNLRAAETMLYSEETGIIDVHTSRVRV